MRTTGTLYFTDRTFGRCLVNIDTMEDVVLARKDAPVSYHLAVVVDDAMQEVTEVTRGQDLLAVTPIHRLLQAILGFPEPIWNHHPLVYDTNDRRISKRQGGFTIRSLRESGLNCDAVLSLAESWARSQTDDTNSACTI
jgi:glutamyl-Q tRNA(Asp) synthetase